MLKVKAQAQAHTSATPDQEVNIPSSHEDSTSCDHESESEILFHPSRQPATIPVRQQMFMPYIEGPKMDWTVNGSLYYHFLKWKLKCKNILECELATLPEPQQCKKLIAWSGDFGMDQYVSRGLTKDELELETIWSWFEEFCKPQSKEVHARFDLLTSFCQGSRSVDEWYNCVQASCDTSTLTSHMVNTRSGSPRPSQGLYQTKIQIKGKQATTRRPLTPEVHTSRKIDVANVVIPLTWKVLLALQKIPM